jgi:hypothetical protein
LCDRLCQEDRVLPSHRYSQTGEELLFDLDADPRETHTLLFDAEASARVTPWRRRLVRERRDRPEGFVEGNALVAGRPHDFLVPGHNRVRQTEDRPARGDRESG